MRPEGTGVGEEAHGLMEAVRVPGVQGLLPRWQQPLLQRGQPWRCGVCHPRSQHEEKCRMGLIHGWTDAIVNNLSLACEVARKGAQLGFARNLGLLNQRSF